MQNSEYDKMKHNKLAKLYYYAIIELCEKYSPDKITVKMISDKAGTSRQAFYNLFPDKYALINYVCYCDMIRFPDIGLENNSNESPGLQIKKSIRDHYEKESSLYKKSGFYKKIINMEGQNSFKEWYRELWLNYNRKAALDFYHEEGYTPMLDYIIRTYVDGLCNIFFNWILSGCTSMSVEEIAGLHYKCIPTELMVILETKIAKRQLPQPE